MEKDNNGNGEREKWWIQKSKDLTKDLNDVLPGNVGESVQQWTDQNSRTASTENNIAKVTGRAKVERRCLQCLTCQETAIQNSKNASN